MIFWYTMSVDCIREWLTCICLVGAAAFTVAWLVLANRSRLVRAADRIAKTPRSAVAAFLFFVAIATVCAQKHGGTNAPPNGASPPQMAGMLPPGLAPSSLPGGIAAGGSAVLHYSLSVLQSNEAVRAENWWRRGAWEDVMRVWFPQGWVFPFGEDHLTFVDVVSQGSLRRRWTDTNEVASVGIRLALAPFSSEFRHEFTPSNSCRFVWSGALEERMSDAPVDASIELFRDGSVAFETNGVSWRTERPWVYGETNAVMDSAEADSMVGGNGMFAFAVEFQSAPPETVCLCVGTNRVAVSDARECCFVLEKGARHAISLSYVPDGVSFRWWDEPSNLRSPPMRLGEFTERMEAFGSAGEVDFEDPSDDGTGSIQWDCSLYISPSSVDDPTYPIRLFAWMDIPPGEWPHVTWRSDDGAVSETGEWLTLAARPSSDVIGVTATWRGRTWRGSVVFWNDVEESVVSLDGGGTIFVESAYTNYPGETTVRTSTEQKLTAHWALRDYGPVTLSATEGAAVNVRLDSPNGTLVELPYSWYGCPGDVGSQDFYVTNNDPSRAGESVTFTLEFDGEDGDYDSDSSGLLEVVRYRVVADALWPSNRVRHVFGPVETFKVYIEGGPTLPFDAPLTPGECNMSFDYNGSTCTFPIRVIAPSGEVGYWRADDFECSGSTIGAGFFADVQVLPTYVSFKDLWIMEDEAGVSGRWGCFENLQLYPHEQFAHTPARGARNPLRIGTENKVDGYDRAQTKLGEMPSDNGGFTLDIPLKWGINGGPCIYDAGHVLQTTSVQTNGNVTISKFGITRGREPYGLYEGN